MENYIYDIEMSQKIFLKSTLHSTIDINLIVVSIHFVVVVYLA